MSTENTRLDWQIAVFCQNERSRIAACLASIAAAVGSRRARITVIVNGSTDGSAAAAIAAAPGVPMEVFTISHADKSNAINQFLYDRNLRADADLYFFVDGYATIAPGSLRAMADRLSASPDATAASGVAGNGRTEIHSTQRVLQTGGVLKGQFYAIKPEFVSRMVASGIRLPVGLYRGDGLLGSMVAHDLDALGQPWTNTRLLGVPEALFEIRPLSPLRPGDILRQFRRKIRQMRGMLENAAIKRVIYTNGYAALPERADDMIRDFLKAGPMPRVAVSDFPFMKLALRRHSTATPPDAGSLRPERRYRGL